jgi:multiple sugar transport system substrate-binding protein
VRDSKIKSRLAVPLAAAFAVTALGAGATVAQDEPQFAGLDMDLSGVNLKMAAIGGVQYEGMYEWIDMFEEETGATVELVFLGDGFAIDEYQKLNFGAGTVDFDVAWNHTSFMGAYENFVEDLNQYFTEEELAAYSPGILEAATLNGALQLIPRHADVSALWYRTDLFEDPELQAGFEEAYGYPLAPPATLEEMYDMAEYLVGEGAVTYGTQFAGEEEALSGRFYELLFANGGNYFDEDLNPIFDSEAGRISAQWMRDLYENGLIPVDTTTLRWDSVNQNFCNGDVAFYLEWYGFYTPTQDPERCPAVAGKFGMARGPQGAAGVHTGWAGAHAMSITKASENKEAAAQLIKFLSSEAVQLDETLKQGVLPVRADVSERAVAAAQGSDNPLDIERWELANVQISEDFRTPPLFADWLSFSDGWFPTLQSIILGDVSVEEGLAKGVSDAEELFDALGY